ncbi:MAG TPA: (Fe-S)-binding protein [Candidatus Eremiobacteraceae bacterium]
MTDVRTYRRGEPVALFVPCFVDVFNPEAARAVVSVLERLAVRVEYPSEQTCCGQPAYNAGHFAPAEELADRFARVFQDYAWIVTPSGSCAAMARAGFAHLSPSSPAASVGARVYDFASFLTGVLGVADVGARFAHRVTFHEGCHALRELGALDASLRLLGAVRDLTLVDLPLADECCGFGGSFSVSFDALSTSMGEAKCDHALSTGAEFLVSGDPSCLLHVGGMLRKRSSALKTLHLAEVLAAT